MSQQSELDLLGREPPPGPLTFEQFHDWCDEDTRAEWVDGEVVLLSPSSRRDAVLTLFLLRVLGTWIEVRGLGELYGSDILMRLPMPQRRARMPDLLFVARRNLSRLRPTFLDDGADLVVEIVSPDSVERDRRERFAEYERAGIPEYWLLDPREERAEFYELGADGRYRLAFGGHGGTYRSRALDGFLLEVEWLWQDPPPPTLDVLRKLGLLA